MARSLQGSVSTTYRSWSQLTFFKFFITCKTYCGHFQPKYVTRTLGTTPSMRGRTGVKHGWHREVCNNCGDRICIYIYPYNIMLLGSERDHGDDVQIHHWKYVWYITPKNHLRLRAPLVLQRPPGGSTPFTHNSPTICRRKDGRRRTTRRSEASRGRVCSLPGVADNRKYMEILMIQ